MERVDWSEKKRNEILKNWKQNNTNDEDEMVGWSFGAQNDWGEAQRRREEKIITIIIKEANQIVVCLLLWRL